MALPERKRPAHPSPIERADRPTLVFLTVCVRDRRRLLASPPAHELLRTAWQSANRWVIGDYIVMPDHIHLFCSAADPATRLRVWIEYWQWLVTRQWPVASEKPLWQRDHWDTQLRTGQSYSAKWDYVRRNPVRAGLVSDPDEWPHQGQMSLLPWTER